jgi:hypothetical protein
MNIERQRHTEGTVPNHANLLNWAIFIWTSKSPLLHMDIPQTRDMDSVKCEDPHIHLCRKEETRFREEAAETP